MVSRLIIGILSLLGTTSLTTSLTTSSTGAWAPQGSRTPSSTRIDQRDPLLCTYDIDPYVSCVDGRYVDVTDGITYDCLEDRRTVLEEVNACRCDVGLGLFHGGDNATIVRRVFGTTYVLVTRRYDAREAMWTVFSPFEPSLWVLVMLTPLAVAIAMTYFSWAISWYKKKAFDIAVLPQYAFQNTLALLNDYTSVDYRLDWTGRKRYMILLKFFLQSMLVSYAFLCLVITSVYTAQLTNILFANTMVDDNQYVYIDELDAQGMNGDVLVPRDISYLLSTMPNDVLYDATTQGVLDVVRRVVDNAPQTQTPRVVAPLEAAVYAIEKAGVECHVSLQLVRGLTNDVTNVASPCLNAYDVAIMFNKTSIARVAHMNSFLRAFVRRRTACTENVPRIGIRDISGGWIIVSISIAIPLLLTVGRYLFFLARKCIAQYGHMFVLPFSSSSEGSNVSNQSLDDDDSGNQRRTVELTAEEIKTLAACGRIRVVARPHLERASSPAGHDHGRDRNV